MHSLVFVIEPFVIGICTDRCLLIGVLFINIMVLILKVTLSVVSPEGAESAYHTLIRVCVNDVPFC